MHDRESSLDKVCRTLASEPAEKLTAALTVPAMRRSVSALVATYNRCPFDPAGERANDNPLTWALDTLVGQVGDALAEIVVVDDGSTDHTAEVLDRYSDGHGDIAIVVRRHQEHRGAFAARNDATALARCDMLLFGDDDCVFPPHYAAGAAYLLNHAGRRDPAACAVTLPFYYRALRPRQVVPQDQIGRHDTTRARYTTNFHCYPAEYLPQPPRIGGAGPHVPFPSQAINGTCIVTARALHNAGGFEDLSFWRTSYSDHLMLAAALTGRGGKLYHCPDPRLGAAHLKFGAEGRYQLHPEDLERVVPALGRRFGDLVEISAAPRTATGCRVPVEEFLVEMIGSFFAFYLKADPVGALRWGTATYRDFVEQGILYTEAVADAPALGTRRHLWRCGLAAGARFASGHAPGVPAGRAQRVLGQIARRVGEKPIRVAEG